MSWGMSCLRNVPQLWPLEQTSGDHAHDGDSPWQLVSVAPGEGKFHVCSCQWWQLLSVFQQLLLEWKPGRGSSHSCIHWQLEKSPYSPFLPVSVAPQKGPARRSFQNGLCWIFWRTNLRKFQNNPYNVQWILSYSPTTPLTPLVVLDSMTQNELLPLPRGTGSQQWSLLLSSESNASHSFT